MGRWVFALATAVLLGISADSRAEDQSADQSSPAADTLFKQLDQDGDSRVTSDEAGEEKARLFKRLLRTSDKDGDGKLSQDELTAGLAEQKPDGLEATSKPDGAAGERRRPGDFFKRLDTNSDGKISADELPEQRREAMLKNLDKDGDQTITPAEFADGAREFARRAGRDGRPGGRDGRPGDAGVVGLTSALDTNSDGELSSDEISAAGEALKKLDRNGDGRLDRRELGGPRLASDDASAKADSKDEKSDRAAGVEILIQRILQADANKDGKFSQDEAPDRLKKGFSRFDANSDGAIDEAELRARFERAKDKKTRAKPAKAKKAEKQPKKLEGT